MKILTKILQYIADTIIDKLSKTTNEKQFVKLYNFGMAFNNFCVYILYINLE